MRRNAALWGQVLAGVVAALFAFAGWLSPFSPLAGLLGVAMTVAVALALVGLMFELAMVPFRSSGLLVPIPRYWLPWAGLGILATAGVLSGLFERGLPGDLAIKLISALAPAVTAASTAMWLYSRSRRSE
jgi:hypothetical protein